MENQKVEKILNQERKRRLKEDIDNQKSCLVLKKKLEYLVQNPKGKGIFSIANIDKIIPLPFAPSYYCDCDEVQTFIKEINKSGPIKIDSNDKYFVEYIIVYPNIYNNTIKYSL